MTIYYTINTIHILNYSYVPIELIDFFKQSSHSAEVFIWDDGSSDQIVQSISNYIGPNSSITLKTQTHNLGRAAMRQKILNNFSGEWAVFMDSDMVPVVDFFQILQQTIRQKNIVYCGKYLYPEITPDYDHFLHFKYGRHREIPLSSNKKFTTGLYILHSSIKDKLNFDTHLTQYGHEDTLIGQLLEANQIKIESTPTLAIHTGLHPRATFIKHQLQAVENLVFLESKDISISTALTTWAHRIEKWPLLSRLFTASKVKAFFLRHLYDSDPNLLFLDGLKLSHYLQLKMERKIK